METISKVEKLAKQRLTIRYSVRRVDDDVLYSARTVEQFDCWSKYLPLSALGLWGCTLLKADVSGSCSRGTTLSFPISTDLLFGTASFLVRPSQFNASALAAFMDCAPSSAHFEDDLYFASLLKQSGVDRFIIPIDRRQLVQVDTLLVERGSLMNTDNADNNHFAIMTAFYHAVRSPAPDTMVRDELEALRTRHPPVCPFP